MSPVLKRATIFFPSKSTEKGQRNCTLRINKKKHQKRQVSRLTVMWNRCGVQVLMTTNTNFVRRGQLSRHLIIMRRRQYNGIPLKTVNSNKDLVEYFLCSLTKCTHTHMDARVTSTGATERIFIEFRSIVKCPATPVLTQIIFSLQKK